MKFTVPIDILSSRIASVTLKLDDDGNLRTQVKVTGLLTPETADALHCGTTVYVGESPRIEQGVRLDLGKATFCMAFKSVLEPHEMKKNSLHLHGDQVDSFSIERAGDLLLLNCRMQLQGGLFDILEYLNVIGAWPALCRIEPLQRDLMEAADVAKTQAGREPTISVNGGPDVPLSMVRKALDVVKGSRPEPAATEQSTKGIPGDPNAPEWRTEEEIRAGVPHHILKPVVN